MNQSLDKNISKHISLSEKEKEIISNALIEKEIKRKEVLIFEGAPCRNLFFISSGLLRAYSHNDDGKEITVMFAKKDWWITDMNSFVNHTPSTVRIEALKNSTVLSINRNSLDNLFETIPSFNILWRKLMQNAYCREQNRVVEILTMPASKRYLNFTKKYPGITKSITQRQLASYLGITPEFLSTLKSNLNVP